LEEALEADLHLEGDDNLEETKLLAQLAISELLEDEDEQMKQEAQLALDETLEDGGVEQMGQQEQEVSRATSDAGSLEGVKQAARSHLEELLLAELARESQGLERGEDEHIKQEAQEALEASMDEAGMQEAQEALEASMDEASMQEAREVLEARMDEARVDLESSAGAGSHEGLEHEAQATPNAQDAVAHEALEARAGGSEGMMQDSRALRGKAVVALVQARQQGLIAAVLQKRACSIEAAGIEGEERQEAKEAFEAGLGEAGREHGAKSLALEPIESSTCSRP